MAGSHGKSWSSTYSPRPAASVPDSAQEGSLSALEKEKTVQSLRGGSVSGGRGLPLSTDVQALLRGCVNTANGTGRPTWLFPISNIQHCSVNVKEQPTTGTHYTHFASFHLCQTLILDKFRSGMHLICMLSTLTAIQWYYYVCRGGRHLIILQIFQTVSRLQFLMLGAVRIQWHHVGAGWKTIGSTGRV